MQYTVNQGLMCLSFFADSSAFLLNPFCRWCRAAQSFCAH